MKMYQSCLRAHNANVHFIFTSNTNDINFTAIIIVVGIQHCLEKGESGRRIKTIQMNYLMYLTLFTGCIPCECWQNTFDFP